MSIDDPTAARSSFRTTRRDISSARAESWSAQGFNTVQLTLMLVDVHELAVDGWSDESVVDLSLERSGELISATTTAGPATLRITARAATLTSISAYQNEEQ